MLAAETPPPWSRIRIDKYGDPAGRAGVGGSGEGEIVTSTGDMGTEEYSPCVLR
jgi:hypothetical protein